MLTILANYHQNSVSVRSSWTDDTHFNKLISTIWVFGFRKTQTLTTMFQFTSIRVTPDNKDIKSERESSYLTSYNHWRIRKTRENRNIWKCQNFIIYITYVLYKTFSLYQSSKKITYILGFKFRLVLSNRLEKFWASCSSFKIHIPISDLTMINYFTYILRFRFGLVLSNRVRTIIRYPLVR